MRLEFIGPKIINNRYKILEVSIKYFMRDLICDVNYSAWREKL